jgi:hypothetical protein
VSIETGPTVPAATPKQMTADHGSSSAANLLAAVPA